MLENQFVLTTILNYLFIIIGVLPYELRTSNIFHFPACSSYLTHTKSFTRVLNLSTHKSNDFPWKLELESHLYEVTENFKEKLNSFQTDQISTQTLEGLKISHYGANIILKKLASIQYVNRHTAEIVPRDLNALPNIRKSIIQSNLWQFSDRDPKSILVSIPPLTDETRNALKREVKDVLESYKIKMRNIKRTTQEDLKTNEKDKLISKDDLKKALTQLQKILDTHTKTLDKIYAKKLGMIIQDK